MNELVFNHLREVLYEFSTYFIAQAKQNLTPSNASYKLVDSIYATVTVNNLEYSVTVELEDYWYWVNNGRKSGKFPPVNAIREWIKIKPVLPKVMTLTRVWYTNGRKRGAPKTIRNTRTYQHLPTVNELAFLIGRKIKEKGTTGTHFFDKAKEDAVSLFRESIVFAIREDIETYINEVLVQNSEEDLFA